MSVCWFRPMRRLWCVFQLPVLVGPVLRRAPPPGCSLHMDAYSVFSLEQHQQTGFVMWLWLWQHMSMTHSQQGPPHRILLCIRACFLLPLDVCTTAEPCWQEVPTLLDLGAASCCSSTCVAAQRLSDACRISEITPTRYDLTHTHRYSFFDSSRTNTHSDT